MKCFINIKSLLMIFNVVKIEKKLLKIKIGMFFKNFK